MGNDTHLFCDERDERRFLIMKYNIYLPMKIGGVISKLLSEVMTASGGRHDKCDQSETISISEHYKRVRLEQCYSGSVQYCNVVQLHDWHKYSSERRYILGFYVKIRRKFDSAVRIRKISFVPSISRMGDLGKLDCCELDALEVA